MEKHRLTYSQLLTMNERDERSKRNAESRALYLLLIGAVAGATMVLCFVST